MVVREAAAVVDKALSVADARPPICEVVKPDTSVVVRPATVVVVRPLSAVTVNPGTMVEVSKVCASRAVMSAEVNPRS